MNQPIQPTAVFDPTKNAESNPHEQTVSLLPVPGYELTELIGRGGMGDVYRARDLEMERDVAVKILQQRFPVDSPTALRFVEEAKITGQLQHPGIPAIHRVSKLPDGRPFLAMKLIKGQTLDELLTSGERLNSLALIESIAQALGYAHAHQVIHRDIKPANVMVGPFGEVQLMDWGLSKVVMPNPERQRSQHDPEATTATTLILSTRDSSQTLDGSVMGTPAYMAPEQAGGENDRVGTASDVFGLGALWCKLLTGQPPSTGDDAESVRRNAMRGKHDEAFARLDTCGAEQEVIALVKQCLAFEPADRPKDANEVARRVAELRIAADERAKQAEIAKAAETVRAEEQAVRQRLRTRLATGIACALAIGAGVALWQAKRASDAEAATAFQLIETKKAEATARARTKEVQDTLAIVQERTSLAQGAYSDFVFGIQMKLETRPGTQELRRELLTLARNGLAKILEDARKQGNPDKTLMWSHFYMGDVERQLGNTLAAQQEYQAGYQLAKQLTDADPTDTQAQRDLSISYQSLGDVSLALGNSAKAMEFFQKSLEVCSRLAEAHPKDAVFQRSLSVAIERIGMLYEQLEKTKEARTQYERMLVIKKQLAEENPGDVRAQRELAVAWNHLGDVLSRLGEAQEALGFFRKGLDVTLRLAAEDPKNNNAKRDVNVSYGRIGDVLLRLGKTKEALDFYRKNQETSVQLAEVDPKNAEAQRDLSICWERLGNVSLRLNQPKEAIEYYQKSQQICERLVAVDPGNTQYQRDLCVNYYRLGEVSYQLRQLKEAAEFYQKHEGILTRLVAADPSNGDLQRGLRVSYERLASTSLELGQTREAFAFYNKHHEVCLRSAETNPTNIDIQRNLGISYYRLGEVSLKLGQVSEAISFLKKNNEVCMRLVAANPSNALLKRDLALSYGSLGDVSLQLGQVNEALTYFQKDKEICESLTLADPKDALSKRQLSTTIERVGMAFEQLGKISEARSHYQQMLVIKRKLAEDAPGDRMAQLELAFAWSHLGDVTMEMGQFKESQEFYQKCLDIRNRLLAAAPKDLEVKRSLSYCYQKIGLLFEQTLEFEKAIEAFRNAEKFASSYSRPGFFEGELPWVRGRIAINQKAEQAIADLEFLFKQKAEEIPTLLAIRVRALLQRSMPEQAVDSADRFAAWAETQDKARDEQRYNAACQFARCAAKIEKDREKLIGRVLDLLQKTKSAGYFNAERIFHLKHASDFNAIRQYPKFIAFINELESAQKTVASPKKQ